MEGVKKCSDLFADVPGFFFRVRDRYGPKVNCAQQTQRDHRHRRLGKQKG